MRNQLVKQKQVLFPLYHAWHGNGQTKESAENIPEGQRPWVKIRMAAINMVCMNNESIHHTTNSLMQYLNWVSMCVERFKEGVVGMLPMHDCHGSVPVQAQDVLYVRVPYQDVELGVSSHVLDQIVLDCLLFALPHLKVVCRL